MSSHSAEFIFIKKTTTGFVIFQRNLGVGSNVDDRAVFVQMRHTITPSLSWKIALNRKSEIKETRRNV